MRIAECRASRGGRGYFECCPMEYASHSTGRECRVIEMQHIRASENQLPVYQNIW